MNIFSRKIHIILLFSILFIVAPLTIVNASSLTDEVNNVPLDKEWKITFSHPVVESTVTESTMYIEDENGIKLSITPIVNGTVVTLPMPDGGYKGNHRYTLHITSQVMGQVGSITKSLSKPIVKPFSTVGEYAVVKITPDGKNSVVGHYATFNEADGNRDKDEAIIYKNKYVKIPNGVVATKTSGVTIIYKEPTFTSRYEYAGLASDTELHYVDATEKYVKVFVAGQEMYVQHKDVTLIPSTLAKGKSYYYVMNGNELWHRIYQHHNGKYTGSYLAGEKPAFFTAGNQYYSTDGAKFYDESGNFVGESYAYFQFISPRVPTNYSADQLDDYIKSILQVRENSGEARYANATTKSRILELGTRLKEIEQEERINALLILSLAIHESDYGMSCHAQNYNNLFGLTVTDSQNSCDPNNVDTSALKYFNTVSDNVNALVTRLNTSYLNPLKMDEFRYNGLAFGNKMIGMNVRYASDPYWGAKAAGHMYRIDRALGGKDYKKHKLGFTARDEVSVRTEPDTSTNNRAYQYKQYGSIKRFDFMPITLSNTPSETAGWYRVVSELPDNATDLYTVVDNVRIVDTH